MGPHLYLAGIKSVQLESTGVILRTERRAVGRKNPTNILSERDH